MYDFLLPDFSTFDLQSKTKIEYLWIFKFKEVKFFNIPLNSNFKDYRTLTCSFYDNSDKCECILNVNFPPRKLIFYALIFRAIFVVVVYNIWCIWRYDNCISVNAFCNLGKWAQTSSPSFVTIREFLVCYMTVCI